GVEFNINNAFTIDGTDRLNHPVAITHKEKTIFGLNFYPDKQETTNGLKILETFALDICGCAGSWMIDSFIVSEIVEIKLIIGINCKSKKKETTKFLKILETFTLDICGCACSWTIDSFIESEIAEIKSIVGDKKVLCGLSGGVDSSVVAALIHKAIGHQLTSIFVDHGLLRKNEANDVMQLFGNDLKVNIIKVDAVDRFLDKLSGVADPEEKRKIIGNEFIYVFDDEADKLTEIDFLAQGTLYSDVIESGSATGGKVKSH